MIIVFGVMTSNNFKFLPPISKVSGFGTTVPLLIPCGPLRFYVMQMFTKYIGRDFANDVKMKLSRSSYLCWWFPLPW